MLDHERPRRVSMLDSLPVAAIVITAVRIGVRAFGSGEWLHCSESIPAGALVAVPVVLVAAFTGCVLISVSRGRTMMRQHTLGLAASVLVLCGLVLDVLAAGTVECPL